MDPFRGPPADSLAAARLHVQALTECGLSREVLLQALLEDFGDGNPTASMEGSLPKQAASQGQLAVQERAAHQAGFNNRFSVSTASSKSSGRASVLSTATSMSSVSSQAGFGMGIQEFAVLPSPSPAPPVKSNNRGSSKSQGAYWCTFCDVAFQRKFDWKRHEDEFHERYKRYPCPNCNRIFWGANTFNQHHKNAHGCTTCPHADRVVKYTKKKTAWACGYCGGFLASRDRYFDHVARHYEDGCNKSHWNHSLVIYGLLHQPSIIQAWKELDSELYGHLPRNQQPMFEWDPKTTGHAQGFLEGESPGKLQDLLEFFREGRDDPKFLAHLAHDLATIRLRSEVQATFLSVPSAISTTARPDSEPPRHKAPVKSLSRTKHMSVPQQQRLQQALSPSPPPPPPPPPPSSSSSSSSYNEHYYQAKQCNIVPLPSTFTPKSNPLFTHPQNHEQIAQQGQGVPFPLGQPMMGAGAGPCYDLSIAHVHPHMQLLSQMPPEQQQRIQQAQQEQQPPPPPPPQQHLLGLMNVYDDWSSMAGTVVDDSVFASLLAMGWQHQQGQEQEQQNNSHTHANTNNSHDTRFGRRQDIPMSG
ncbi:hypothetical protein VTH06DRAFT_8708 [Thermothelomyces fergusii]